jgi:hypothetical protein
MSRRQFATEDQASVRGRVMTQAPAGEVSEVREQ